MNISIDFDNTYTLEPQLWNAFIHTAHARGHTVYCVTYRYTNEAAEVLDSIGKVIGKDKCIFTNHNNKREFCNNLGVHIDVWVDDMPQLI